LEELRATVFLTGCRTAADLHARPRVILGETRMWLEQLGYFPTGPEDAQQPLA
jgi:hypothetical protein